MAPEQATKHQPQGQQANHNREQVQTRAQLTNAYMNRNRKEHKIKSIVTDEATEWFNGAKTILENPTAFGLATAPVKDIPTLQEFLDDCRDLAQKAA